MGQGLQGSSAGAALRWLRSGSPYTAPLFVLVMLNGSGLPGPEAEGPVLTTCGAHATESRTGRALAT